MSNNETGFVVVRSALVTYGAYAYWKPELIEQTRDMSINDCHAWYDARQSEYLAHNEHDAKYTILRLDDYIDPANTDANELMWEQYCEGEDIDYAFGEGSNIEHDHYVLDDYIAEHYFDVCVRAL